MHDLVRETAGDEVRGDALLAAKASDAIKVTQTTSITDTGKDDVKIIWKGNRIARVIFKSGKVVEFQT